MVGCFYLLSFAFFLFAGHHDFRFRHSSYQTKIGLPFFQKKKRFLLCLLHILQRSLSLSLLLALSKQSPKPSKTATMFFPSMVVVRRLLGTIVLFQLQVSVLIVASFSSSQSSALNGRSQIRHRHIHRHRQPIFGQDKDGDEFEFESNPNQLLPAQSRIHFNFSAKRKIPNLSFSTKGNLNSQQQQQQQQQQQHQHQHLVLYRRDGIDLYGRKVVYHVGDTKAATMSFFSIQSVIGKLLDETETTTTSSIWDATMVLRPENGDERRDDGPFLFSSGDTRASCFVAMNRFQVKEDCKRLFEERWANRNSKLPHQPGFIGFSLLRKRVTESLNEEPNEHERFNYSTCTMWDSIGSWECWRNGGGKTSHEASRETTTAGQKRVPVSEWLEGPSSPIFWDGKVFPKEVPKDAHSTSDFVSK